MGPYVFGNALLTGFFASAALRFVMHWRYSRREQVPPVMALHCLLLALFCPWIVVLATARTIPQAQLALDMRSTVGLVLHVTMAWALWLATGVRARWYVATMAAVCLPLSLINLLVFPITGPVTSLQSVMTTWGEDIVIPTHTSPLWMAPILALLMTVDILGFVGAAALWQRDRFGAVLIASGTAGTFIAHVMAVLVEVLDYQMSFLGAFPQALFVVVISAQISREYARRGEELAKSEERYRLIVKNQTEFIVKWLPDGTRTFVNDSYCKYFGVRAEDCVGSSFLPLVAPEYREAIRRKVASITPENPAVTDEHLSIALGGEHRWQQWTDSGVFDEKGTLIEIQSVGRDIHDRKLAELKLQTYHERLRALSQELLHAQEGERRRLARELHDEIGQMLTVVGLRLHRLKSGETQLTIDEDIACVNRTIEQVRQMSLDLRPPMLDVLGLEAALRWYAESQQKRTGVNIEVLGHLEPGRRQPELEIACFRVVQEALTNVIRHAHAKQVNIQLSQTELELRVVIHDDGVGFDLDAVQKRAGRGGSFGVLAMRERTELLGGCFVIESALGQGTRIDARFPLAASSAPEGRS